MRIYWIYVIILLTVASCKEEHASTIIAFGSCSIQESKDQLWTEVLEEHPDVWIWGGDNIYGDSKILDTLQRKYATQKDHPAYQRMMQNMIITGTWDDHDYGINDGGKLFSAKKISQQAFLDFMDVPKDDPRRNQEGIYSSLTIGKGNNSVKIINLDTRYHRDTLLREYYIDSISQRRRYNAIPNTEGDILGETQWQWLESELTNSTAAINIINSSIQVIAEDHPFEKWANFPVARQRLFDLIVKSKAEGVLIITGDRHIAEFSKIRLEGLPYPLYDFTSSGLTHTYADGASEINGHRIGNVITQVNYGIIKIEWLDTNTKVTLSIQGKDGVSYQKEMINYPIK